MRYNEIRFFDWHGKEFIIQLSGGKIVMITIKDFKIKNTTKSTG